MRRQEAIRTIKAAARAGTLIFTDHAREKIASCCETPDSVANAIANASAFTAQPDGTYNVRGEGLAAVVAMRDKVVAVTVYLAG